ncbi:ripening-related protein 3-like [Panicum miliaceum]|uniref:Ripening-related protein 3-like n=1 Tax=Panicum miliaceum TaxID=4540 RepID=A0A3L6S4H7_PANMI|nr:ripening-related protein 3-like [Panicum miliaceum]
MASATTARRRLSSTILALAAVLPLALAAASSPHRALLQSSSCQPSGSIRGSRPLQPRERLRVLRGREALRHLRGVESFCEKAKWDEVLQVDKIVAVSEQFIGFISREILDPRGEFYHDSHPVHGPSTSTS